MVFTILKSSSDLPEYYLKFSIFDSFIVSFFSQLYKEYKSELNNTVLFRDFVNSDLIRYFYYFYLLQTN